MTERVLDVDEESPDLMEVVTMPEIRVRCLLLIGDQTELVVDGGDPEDVVRHPAADVAAQAGIPAAELPGKLLVVLLDGEDEGYRRLAGFRLAD